MYCLRNNSEWKGVNYTCWYKLHMWIHFIKELSPTVFDELVAQKGCFSFKEIQVKWEFVMLDTLKNTCIKFCRNKGFGFSVTLCVILVDLTKVD